MANFASHAVGVVHCSEFQMDTGQLTNICLYIEFIHTLSQLQIITRLIQAYLNSHELHDNQVLTD
jgi:putative effector of murein hydrolase